MYLNNNIVTYVNVNPPEFWKGYCLLACVIMSVSVVFALCISVGGGGSVDKATSVSCV